MSVVDVIVFGGCVSRFLAELATWFWRSLCPTVVRAALHVSACDRLLREGALPAAQARYRRVRDEARRLPAVACLVEAQLQLLQRLLASEAPHRDGTLGGERARFDELWGDLMALAERPRLSARGRHLVVHALAGVLWQLDPRDQQRAAAALRAMERLGDHCAECAAECRVGRHDFGRVLSELPRPARDD